MFRIREEKQSCLFNRFKNVDSFSDKMCTDHTSYTKDQLLLINNHLTSLKNSPARTKIQALVVYLKWLKTGLTQTQLALYFGIPSRQSISDYCQQVRDAMVKDFVPLYYT